MNLRLHNKYGVNPTVFSCFVCGKDVGVALLGAGYHGEAPRHIGALDDKPCDECKKFMSQGVILIMETLTSLGVLSVELVPAKEGV
jgi:hypothetical protein